MKEEINWFRTSLEWSGLLGVPGGAILGAYKYLRADYLVSTQKIQATMALETLAILALLITVYLFAKAHAKERRDYRETLGIRELRYRSDPGVKLGAAYAQVKKHYYWSGLSAVNELSRTEIQERVAEQGSLGISFKFTLLNPSDVFRVREQTEWEGSALRRPEDISKNIQRSAAALAKLSSSPSIECHFLSRIPCFRVSVLDENEIHVAHYDRGGCGFYGEILVLQHSDLAKAPGLLFRWFERFAEVERRNAIIELLNTKILRCLAKGSSTDEIVQDVMRGRNFEHTRTVFYKNFQWDLTDADVNKAVLELSQRFGFT